MKIEDRLAESGYSNYYKVGKDGIKKNHRNTIRAKNNHNLLGSIDIDQACKNSEPSSSRWDYMVVVLKGDKENLALIEVHPAANGNAIKEIVEKKHWVVKWLKNSKLESFKKRFFWIATNKICFNAGSKYAKQLAHLGIKMPRRVTPLLDIDVNYY